MDPNDKLIAVGCGEFLHITPDTLIPYTIRFENMATAELPAQLITVTDPLPEQLDWMTFQFGDMQFGDHLIQVQPGLMYYYAEVDLRPEGQHLIVGVEADFDPLSGVARWTFTGLDPETGELTEDPLAGFLPPNVVKGEGEGYVKFSIMPDPDLVGGDQIENVARIVFDWNEPIDTPLVFNTIDLGAPSSSVAALGPESPSDIPVSWSGADDDGGSGVASYDIYVSLDGADFELWLEGTAATSAIYPGEAGREYSFYSIATDWVGYREEKVPAAEVTTIANAVPRVSLTDPAPWTTVNPGDLFVVSWEDSDPDDNAAVSLFWDTDTDLFNNTAVRGEAPRPSRNSGDDYAAGDGMPQTAEAVTTNREAPAGSRSTDRWGLIVEGISEDDPADGFGWAIPADLGADTVFLFALITDGVGEHIDYTVRPIYVGDIDGDGMLDSWEELAVAALGGIDAIEEFGPDDDSDGDGWTNRQERDGQSDPADETSVPDWSLKLYVSGATIPELELGFLSDATDGWDDALDMLTDATSMYLVGPDAELHPRLEKSFLAPEPEWTWRLVADPIRDLIEVAWDRDGIPLDHGLFLTRVDAGRQAGEGSIDMVESSSAYFSTPGEYEIELERPEVLDLDLAPGWNLISLPMQIRDNSIAAVFGRKHLGPIWAWRDTDGGGEFEKLTVIDPQVGAWIRVTQPVREPLRLRGRPLRDRPLALSPGWNLVGPTSECGPPVNAAIIPPIWHWDAAAQGYSRVGAGGPLVAGEAYWIYARESVVVKLGR